VDASDAITARLTAAPVLAAPVGPPVTEISGVTSLAPLPMAERVAAEPLPSIIVDEMSDGVVMHHIATADTAPVKRRHPPSDRPDDRPGDTTGEITMPRTRPTIEVRKSEPTILVADLAAVHTAVSAVASEQAAAPATPDAAAPQHEVPVAKARSDATKFSEADEAFFRAGHEREAVVVTPVIESFDDLDEGYRPVGFWERLRGRVEEQNKRPPTEPGKGEPEK
jgi:hypothetical protein